MSFPTTRAPNLKFHSHQRKLRNLNQTRFQTSLDFSPEDNTDHLLHQLMRLTYIGVFNLAFASSSNCCACQACC